tara:strand:- start:5158 stop:5325 length:168 start_codon:yes stop_codon:yes gene_type:complete
MPNKRKEGKRLMGFWVDQDFKRAVEEEAKRRGMPAAELIREILNDEMKRNKRGDK